MTEILFYGDCQELSTQKKIQPFSFRNEGFRAVLKIWREITERGKNPQFFFQKFFICPKTSSQKKFQQNWTVGSGLGGNLALNMDFGTAPLSVKGLVNLLQGVIK